MNIFISHSSKDKQFGEVIVQLLLDIGVPKTNITFTSLKAFGIPLSGNIFDWLKNKLKEKPLVLYLLSNSYYQSIPCLNEMGASWVVENDHVSLFVPNFNPDVKEFQEGAIDPRQMGVFLNKKEDIVQLSDFIISANSINISHVEFDRITTKAHNSIMQLTSIEGSRKQEAELKPTETRVNVKDKVEATAYSGLYSNIMQNKLTPEEMLLIKYMIDTSRVTLGDRWLAEQEIQRIREWENVSSLDSFLSHNYSQALSRFNLRKYLEIRSTTSYGNPREYALVPDLATMIVDLPSEIQEKLEAITAKHQKKVRSAELIDDDDMPF